MFGFGGLDNYQKKRKKLNSNKTKGKIKIENTTYDWGTTKSSAKKTNRMLDLFPGRGLQPKKRRKTALERKRKRQKKSFNMFY